MAGSMPILFGGLIVWGLYRRVRRNIGQQKLCPVRSVFSIVILTAVSVLLVGMAVQLQMPKLLLGIGGGLLLGVPLGLLGLRLTKFETTEAGHFTRRTCASASRCHCCLPGGCSIAFG